MERSDCKLITNDQYSKLFCKSQNHFNSSLTKLKVKQQEELNNTKLLKLMSDHQDWSNKSNSPLELKNRVQVLLSKHIRQIEMYFKCSSYINSRKKLLNILEMHMRT